MRGRYFGRKSQSRARWILDLFSTTASERVEASWPRRQRTTKCPLIMTLHASPVLSEPVPCPLVRVRRGKEEKITMPRATCRTGAGAGHVWLDAIEATPTCHRVSTTTTLDIDYGYLEDKVTSGEQDAGPSPILVTRSSTTQVPSAEVLPCKGTVHPWCVQALVRAIVATGDAKIILLPDKELEILDLERQAADECRVRHGMTVIIDDTTEFESQDDGPAEMAVRQVKGAARSVRVALSELYKKDISSKLLVLPWLVSYAAGQITRGQIGADGLTPHQRLKGRAFRKLLLVFGESAPIGKRASRLPERWSDGLFLGVVERSSEFYVGTVHGVVRARSLRRRPLEERANVEHLDKLVGVARSVRVALSELYKKDISSKLLVLPWLVSYAAGQITRGQIGADGLTPHQRLKGRAFRKLLPVFSESAPHRQESKSSPGALERWIVPRGR